MNTRIKNDNHTPKQALFFWKAGVVLELLRLGSKGEFVKQLQAKLNFLGYRDNNGTRLEEDGSFGPRTEQAVNLFKDTNLPGGNVNVLLDGTVVNWRGQVGETTWEALNTAEPVELPCTPGMPFVPPTSLNTPANTPWPRTQLDGFIAL